MPPAFDAGTDVTRAFAERDRALRALRSSQARCRALIDNPTYGVCEFDPEGRLLDVNRILVDMLGYGSRDELMRLNVASDVMLDARHGAQLLDAYRRTGQVATQDVEWKRKDGTPIVVRIGGRRIWGDSAAGCELIADDVTDERARERHLHHLATTDALTGIGNYRLLRHAIEAETRRSERTARPFAVLLFDLDALKTVNDRYGHEMGNRALRRVAAALGRWSRAIDSPARCGGDEFAIVLPETGATGAGLMGRRVCASLAADGEEPALSLSVGIAVYPHDGGSTDVLLRIADRGLYAMKGQRGGVPATGPDAALVPPAAAPGPSPRQGRAARRSVVKEDAQE